MSGRLSVIVCTEQVHGVMFTVQAGRATGACSTSCCACTLLFPFEERRWWYAPQSWPRVPRMCRWELHLLGSPWCQPTGREADQRNTPNRLNLFLAWFDPSPDEFSGILGLFIFNLNQNYISLAYFRSCHSSYTRTEVLLALCR